MKLAIVGAEERTRDLAPWNDSNTIIWVLNEYATASWCKRCDAVIQIHPSSVYKSLYNNKDPNHWEWLQNAKMPVFMQDVDPQVPASQKYPLEQINKEFLTTLTFEGENVKNFDASICYAVALGLYLRFESIDIYGVELVYDMHYRKQQTNFAFWIGVATGRKVPVNLHCSRALFDKPYYGYEVYMEHRTKLQSYLDGLLLQLEEEKRKVAQVEGAIQICKQLIEEEQKEAEDAKTPKD